jgi:hypothetical protein
MHLVLRDGFHDHTVVITLNDRRVYDSKGVTTDPISARAGAVAVRAPARRAHLGVTVTPGDLVAAFDIDVKDHPHVAISLVGDGTIALESSTLPFR